MKHKMKLELAREILATNIHEIRTVADWAQLMGWDRTEFSRQFSRKFGTSAKDTLHMEKLKTIEGHFFDQPGAKYYEVACDLGFRDEKALYDYIRYHKNCSPGGFKQQLGLLKSA